MNDHQYKKEIKILLKYLQEKNILKGIKSLCFFYDEPKIYHYSAFVNFNKKFSDGRYINSISSSGASFTSKYEALFKCLVEAIERLSLYSYKKKSLISSSYYFLKDKALNPSLYTNKPVDKRMFSWVKGHNLTTDKPTFIPASLLYLNYIRLSREPTLTTRISTGAAGGISHESVLLNGIYEIIERDAFMTAYLNKIPSPLINLDNIKNDDLQRVIENCKRYNLEVYVFNIMNDIGIPVIMSIVIDRSGLGPAVSVGTRACLNIYEAIIDSIRETLVCRLWTKENMYRKLYLPEIDASNMNSVRKRALYWAKTSAIKHLDFWLEQKPIDIKYQKKENKLNNSEELTYLIKLFERRNQHIYYADITMDVFRKLNYLFYKVIIPGLHPLYLYETQQEIRFSRLKQVALHFNINKFTVNKIPHPFL